MPAPIALAATELPPEAKSSDGNEQPVSSILAMRSCHRIADPFGPPGPAFLSRSDSTEKHNAEAGRGFGRERADLEGSSQILEAARVVRG
jgi:hypothetical protein